MRVIAPDHIGYGRSDKLTDATAYTFRRHIDWVRGLVNGLDLREVTLVVQDWGGPIGLSVLAREPDRFARVVATNTILHTCDPALAGRLTWAHHGIDEDRVMLQETLLDYVALYQRAPDINPSLFLDAVAGPLDADVLAAYDAPFPDPRYKAGLRQMTALIPLTRNDPGAAIGRDTMAALAQWERPFLTAYSDADPPTRGWDKVFQEHVPGAQNQEHTTIAGAGHFIAEQKGEELAAVIAQFVQRRKLTRCRQPEHQARAAHRAGLHGRGTAVQVRLLGHQGQTRAPNQTALPSIHGRTARRWPPAPPPARRRRCRRP